MDARARRTSSQSRVPRGPSDRLQRLVSTSEGTPRLDARLDQLERRARAQRALEAMVPAGLGLGGGLVCVFLAHALVGLPEREVYVAVVLGVVAALGLVVAAALRPVDRLRLAIAVDRALGLRGRLGNALALATDPSGLAALARRDAEARAATIDPARVLPLRRPRGLAAAALALVAAGATATLGRAAPRAHPVVSPEMTSRLLPADAPAAVDPDALAALRERMTEARGRASSDEVRATTEAMNDLIERIAAGEIGRAEALARIAELEAGLDRGAARRAEQVRRALAEDARRMREARSTAALSRALTEGRLEDAAEALRALAERTRTEAPPRELIENLRALAQEREREARERELEEREREMERLLQRRREREARGEETPEEQERLLEQRRRELDRLRREHEARQEVERALERLHRELDDAADRMEQEHRRPSEGGSDAMERAAEELSRRAREQQSAEQMRELARELERLREALREAQRSRSEGGRGRDGAGQGESEGAEGEQGGREARLRRFVLRAGGGDDGEGVSIGVRRPGGGGEGSEEGEQGSGEGGQRGQAGRGGPGGEEPGGQGESGGEGQMLLLGEGGDAVLEIPGLGGRGSEGGPRRGSEGEGEGEGRGTGHDPSTLDEASARLAGGRSVRVGGEPGDGPSRSQVIRSASSRGFASRDYERVYGDYASHAEEAIERDRVPPGYRAYVERYFELIRPRSSDPGPR